MTEKRFTLAYKKDNWWAVRDGEITLWKEEVIHLLNELYEENQKLKDERDVYMRRAEAYLYQLKFIARQLEGFSRVPSLERAVDNWKDWTFRMTEEYVELNNKYREECK